MEWEFKDDLVAIREKALEADRAYLSSRPAIGQSSEESVTICKRAQRLRVAAFKAEREVEQMADDLNLDYGYTAGEDYRDRPTPDEYDRAEPALMRRVDEHTAEVDGRLHIDDLNDAIGLAIPEDEDYDTAAGLVFSELGYIPTVGEKLTAYGAEITVLAADERKITRLRVVRSGRAEQR